MITHTFFMTRWFVLRKNFELKLIVNFVNITYWKWYLVNSLGMFSREL